MMPCLRYLSCLAWGADGSTRGHPADDMYAVPCLKHPGVSIHCALSPSRSHHVGQPCEREECASGGTGPLTLPITCIFLAREEVQGTSNPRDHLGQSGWATRGTQTAVQNRYFHSVSSAFSTTAAAFANMIPQDMGRLHLFLQEPELK